MFGDVSILLNDPDRVAREGWLAMSSAIWFTMMPQAPKPRNWLAEQVRDPNGPFRPRAIKNKIKKRKPKHPKQVDFTND